MDGSIFIGANAVTHPAIQPGADRADQLGPPLAGNAGAVDGEAHPYWTNFTFETPGVSAPYNEQSVTSPTSVPPVRVSVRLMITLQARPAGGVDIVLLPLKDSPVFGR